jgi:hypothetical protein
MLGILVLGGIVLAVIGFQWLSGKATSAAVRTVARGSHKLGQQIVTTHLEFRAPLTPQAMTERIADSLNLRTPPHPCWPKSASASAMRTDWSSWSGRS